MKLISLYIENFGGLSKYSLDFQAGLTVVQQPNGFGKTTLAEFIRAMFYGFPRKAKTLEKSRRQKYTPWQGGKFGGNLVFEYQGCRYRLERTFGATPKGDTFTLIDLATGRKSDRFSEEIGTELFRLDSDSFERSTYMPQLHDLTSLTTDSIQAKLGNLVEDTGDMGNYENAVAALKSARSALIPYRGSGGSVAQAQAEVSRLQGQVELTEALEGSICESRSRVEELEALLPDLKNRQQQVRTEILAVSESAAVAAAHREYRQLENRAEALDEALRILNSRYPGGLPSAQRLSAARQAAADLEMLAAADPASPEDLAAEKFLEENRSRFENQLPTREALEHCRDQINRYQTLRTQAGSIGLSESEKELYENLLPLAESGMLDQTRLDKLDAASRKLSRAEQELSAWVLPEADRTALEELKCYFSPGVPSGDEIRQKREALAQAADLRREKASLLEALAGIHPQKPGISIIALFLASLAGIAAGFLLMKTLTVFAVAGFALGGCALAGLVFLCLRRAAGNRECQHRRETLQHRISDLDRQAAAMEQDAAAFAGRYSTTVPLSDALVEIRDNLESFKTLATQMARTAETRKSICAQIQSLRELLTRELGSTDFDKRILDLRMASGQFRDLQEEITAAQAQSARLEAAGSALREEITAFLGRYYPDPVPDHALLADLQRSSDTYAAALDRTAARKQREEAHQADTNRCEQILETFFLETGLTRQGNLREQLLKIRDDCRDFPELTRQHHQAVQQAADYQSANQRLLQRQVTESREDPDSLHQAEGRLNAQFQEASARLAEEKQRLSQNMERYSRLPQLLDELEQWQEKKRRDQNRASQLDETMLFLEKAREKLQSSYLGPLRRSFTGYMARLMGEDGGGILLTPDLDVRLERSGQARELAYFSAGQTDMVMLCMRLALVDALFSDAKPFVILDDPFVNLDDERTAQALALLQDLAQQRQIIYLVCNSSRTPQ